MSAASEVEWTDSSLFSPPIWRTEPDLAVMETIVRTHLDLPVHSPCDITFLGQGFYNKAFKVESDVGIHVIRVSLPIEAPHKMISEVATMRAVIEWTDISVCRVLAFDPTSDNELYYPWMIMGYANGLPLKLQWRNMSADKKAKLVKQMALYQSQLFALRFDSIGSVFPAPAMAQASFSRDDKSLLLGFALLYLFWPVIGLALFVISALVWSAKRCQCSNSQRFVIGPAVSMQFNRLSEDVPRGPFPTNRDWVRASFFATSISPSYHKDSPEYHRQIYEWYESGLAMMYPSPSKDEVLGRMVLHLHEAHWENIVVDDRGDLVAILDWEYTRTHPVWDANPLPMFLDCIDQTARPCIMYYSADQVEDYWCFQDEFEFTTCYRGMFWTEMERLQPGWCQAYRSREAELRRDFQLEYFMYQTEMTDDTRLMDDIERGVSVEKLLTVDEFIVARDAGKVRE